MSLSLIAAAALGVATWSLMEYVIHRWAGHDRRLISRFWNFFGVEHTAHHSRGHYFAPTWKKVLSAFGAAIILMIPGTLVAGFAHGAAWVGGTIGFYLYYELMHRWIHVHGGYTRYGRWARKHHFYHHFHDPSVNHGVTSPVWDMVFGTRARVDVVRVPEKLMLPWLLDAQGQVRTPFLSDFEVRRKKKAA